VPGYTITVTNKNDVQSERGEYNHKIFLLFTSVTVQLRLLSKIHT
jgi:hypothetical protein